MDSPRNDRRALTRRATQQYFKTGVEASGKLDLLIMSYDAAIDAAEKKNKQQLLECVHLLIQGLDLKHAPEFTLGLFQVYRQCEMAAEKEAYKEVRHLLVSLRDAWEVLRQSGQHQPKSIFPKNK